MYSLLSLGIILKLSLGVILKLLWVVQMSVKFSKPLLHGFEFVLCMHYWGWRLEFCKRTKQSTTSQLLARTLLVISPTPFRQSWEKLFFWASKAWMKCNWLACSWSIFVVGTLGGSSFYVIRGCHVTFAKTKFLPFSSDTRNARIIDCQHFQGAKRFGPFSWFL